jgi:negative regulator of sigma-B (phosphoserine phosphatase)
MGVAVIDAAGRNAVVNWAVAGRPLAGQTASGDMYLMKPCRGRVLIAVVDGLGHGTEAAEAAAQAIAALDACAPVSLELLVTLCHEKIAETRGVTLTVASIETLRGEMDWLGVGNVEAVLLPAGESRRRKKAVVLRSGIVGDRLPTLRASTVPVEPGDLLVIATDGVGGGFSDFVDRKAAPRRIAADIIRECGRTSDDALVLVARLKKRG